MILGFDLCLTHDGIKRINKSVKEKEEQNTGKKIKK